jgi:outer membrane protein assembly factor BamB
VGRQHERIAFGRVYMGNTDGRVYSFAAHSGQLAWATSTGAYVYASPAVTNTPGLGPTVYVGSYDGNFYAFDAQSGAMRWSHPAGGKISGSATIVGDVVYYADLGAKNTAGLDARTIYLTGYGDVLQMLPKRKAPAPAPATQPPQQHK